MSACLLAGLLVAIYRKFKLNGFANSTPMETTADNDRQGQAAHRRCGGAVRSRTVVEFASGKGHE